MLTTAGEKARASTVLFYHLKVKELVGTLLADVPYPHSGARMDITEGLWYSSPAAKKAWICWKTDHSQKLELAGREEAEFLF